MRTRRFFTLARAIMFVALVMSPALALAQAQGAWHSYAAKFVCGSENNVPDRVLVSGRYRTVINIHNPHYLMEPTGAPAPVVFFKKAVLALPQGEDPQRPSCHQQEFLDADFALSVTCGNIVQLFQQSGVPFTGPFEGFVVIEVPPQTVEQGTVTPELDVTAVYVARHRTGTNPDVNDYDVQTMDVEKVVPKAIIGVPMIDPCD